jgi:predicted dehydrogenase
MSAKKTPKLVRLGLIGVGNWGRNYIATLRNFPGAVLTRVASRNPDAAVLAGPSCEVVADWRELLFSRELDGVILTSPAPLHAEQLSAAIAAGVPALVEKPLTLSLDQARHVLRQAEARKALVLVDHIYLFHPAYQELKRRAGLLGKPRRLESCGGNLGPFRASVTPLWDYGPHDVSLCLDLLGKMPVEISAESSTARGGEILRVHLGFPGGVRAALRFGNGFAVKERWLKATFEGGGLHFDDLRDVPLRERRPGGSARVVPVETERPMNRALRAFVDAIAAGSRDLASLRLAVDVVAVLEACGTALGRR